MSRVRYWVEIPPGPAAIGEMRAKEFEQRTPAHGTLCLLGPTECVKDRPGIESWARDERAGAKLADFLERLPPAPRG